MARVDEQERVDRIDLDQVNTDRIDSNQAGLIQEGREQVAEENQAFAKLEYQALEETVTLGIGQVEALQDEEERVPGIEPSEPGIRWSKSGAKHVSGRKKRARRRLSPVAYSKHHRLVNRELSWLEFNSRVLDEARDREIPLLERLNFLSITQSNLDEFIQVRVASLKDMVHANYERTDATGMTVSEQLSGIAEQMAFMTARMSSTFLRSLNPALQREGILLLRPDELSEAQTKEVNNYFRDTLFPILTPLAVDSGRPFPLINNGSLNIACLLKPSHENEDSERITAEESFATLQVPDVLPRIFVLKKASTPEVESRARTDVKLAAILLEDIIEMNLPMLFRGREIEAHAIYRILRNADFDIDDEDAADLLAEIEYQVQMREWGEIIRLEASDNVDQRILTYLVNAMHVSKDDIYLVRGPLNLRFLSNLRSHPLLKPYRHYYYEDFEPQVSSILELAKSELIEAGQTNTDIFSCIKQRDILLHHPYEQFDPVLEFMRQAARDPHVLAIKQTLYRVSGDSPLIGYLEEAARNGKQVMVLVELKARFDEENNIHWARRLEKAGCHVIYGLVGLKVHSKITLVVRLEEDGVKRYLHLGTGNYNDQTAKLYTDMGLFLCRESYGTDATEFFNMISGYAQPQDWNKLVPAPFWLRDRSEALIDREIRNAKDGRDAYIKVKMNSLVDERMIEKLYEASSAGVLIDMVVRGICCLRPGVEGLSENIRVVSVVGRFLEHSRIFIYCNDGDEETYLSSADWMPRNLDRRVELLFPVEDELCRERIREVIDYELEDTEGSHVAQPDGAYKRTDRRGKQILDSQQKLMDLAMQRAPVELDVIAKRRFEAITGVDIDRRAEESNGQDREARR